jgi:hypothetical protein
MLGAALAAGLAGCGSSSSGGDDGGSMDARSGDSTTNTDGPGGSDAAPHDGAPKDAAPVDGGSGCFTVTGSGKAETCTFTTCGVTGPSCSGVEGSTFGSCPAAELVGCCVQTVNVDGGSSGEGGSVDAGTCLKANCYYSADAGSKARGNCLTEMYEGFPYDWQPSSP